MRKTSITLQELRRKIYIKAKADNTHRFWGMYVHICKLNTLRESYQMAKRNRGAPGIDGMTFDGIEQSGVEAFLLDIQTELLSGTYRPTRNRIKEIPKANGKTRKLSIATIRDRVVQGAVKLMLEPVFEADFQEGSYGYRPKRTAHQAVERVAEAVVKDKTRVIDDVVILVDGHPKWRWLWAGVNKRLREELQKLQVYINEEKTKQLDLRKGDSFGFLGFDFRRMKTKTGKWRVNYQPKMQARVKLMEKIKDVFQRHKSQPLTRVRELINPILRGWVQYFKIGNSSKVFGYVKDWLTKKIRRHLMKARGRSGFGWKKWSTKGLYAIYNIYSDFRVSPRKVSPTR